MLTSMLVSWFYVQSAEGSNCWLFSEVLEYVPCGVPCAVYTARCMVYGVWCLVFGECERC